MKPNLRLIIETIVERHANPNDYLRRVFAALPRCLGNCPGSQVGPMLHSLLTNTKGDPALFGWLHAQMADHWPEPSAELPQYDPDRVFQDAHALATQQPSQDTMVGALRTMTNLTRQNFVSTDHATDVADAACQMWQYHPEQSAATINIIEAVGYPEFVASMIDGIRGNDEEENSRIADIWKVIAIRGDMGHRINTGLHLLSKPAKGSGEKPDLCLELWINANGDDQEPLLEALLSADDLNDEQRRRVWLQIEQTDGLEADFLFRAIPKVVGLSESPQTTTALLDFQQQLTGKASTEDQRYALGQRIVEAFRASSSQEAKNRLAAWLKELNVDAVLQEVVKYGDLTDDEAAILDSQFGRSRHWKKVKPQ